MEDGDEEIVDGVETDPANPPSSPESQEPSGQDAPAGDDDSEVSAQQPDDTEDDGEPQPRTERGAEAAPQSRGAGRIQRLANEAKEARERADKATRELEEFKRTQWTQQRQQNEALERERRALMTPQEQTAYDLAQLQQRQTAFENNVLLRTEMATDKINFDANCRTDPFYRRYQDAVNQRFDEQVAKGRPVDRETLLRQIVGDEAVNSARNNAHRRAANGRVNAQKVKPSNSKGDQAAARSKTGSTAEERLKGVLI
jgi:hypothetical protein